MPSVRLRRALRALIDLGAVGTALVFVGSYYPASVMLTPTITNGGDMGSHYYPVLFLRDVLLPKGQVVGWCPGNYCGFPLFQFYFPLPFIVAAVLSYAVPLPVAFKLASVLGTFLLPLCAYLSLRLARVPFPGPALGALAPLCFLFMEANSMWGGNIPSTLAGEFSFSLGLALAVLFIGTLHRTIETGRGWAWNGLLVAATGLAHGYTLLWAGGVSLLALVALRGWWRRLGLLVAIHGLAVLLLAFWLVPLLLYAPWTTAFNHVWPIQKWQEVLPPILWPAAGVAVATGLVEGVIALWRRTPYPRPLATLWGTTLVSLVFYVSAHSFHVPDIRFMPFIQLSLCLAAAAGLGYLVARFPAPEMMAIAGALAIPPFVQSKVTFIQAWINWNYAGFEKKGPWPVLRGISEALKGDFRDPRVVYEHSPVHEGLGTVRVFESLPLFTGRSTLEGLYMQGSPTSPFVFYTQSEISKDISCPLPDWGCARLDLDRGLAHLRMFNVSQFIVRSEPVKALAARHPGLEREAVVGEYEIYRVRDNDPRYAVPLARAPFLVRGSDWKRASYRWWKGAGPEDPVPVFAEEASAEEEKLFASVTPGLPAQAPVQALGPPPPLVERMETDRITVSGCRPGHPVLVRISYHPRWQATTGERVWLAGPSFMLVFPRGERFELVFGSGPPTVLGDVLTVLGWLVFLGAVLPVRSSLARLGRRAVRPLAEARPIDAAVGLVRATAGWGLGTRRLALALGLVLAAGLFAGLAAAVRTADAEGIYRRGQRLFEAGRLAEARAHFQETQRLSPLAAISYHSAYFEAITLYREHQWKAAEQVFQRLVREFPEAPNAPEALYHVGLCRRELGDRPGAIAAFEAVQQRFAGVPWARYAGDRLREMAVPATPPA